MRHIHETFKGTRTVRWLQSGRVQTVEVLTGEKIDWQSTVSKGPKGGFKPYEMRYLESAGFDGTLLYFGDEQWEGAIAQCTDVAYKATAPNLYNNLLSKMNEAVIGASVNAPVAMAEARKTGKMLKEAFTPRGIMSQYVNMVTKSLPKGRRFKYGSPLHIPSNLWLQWSYGWKPFASDLYNLADLSMERAEGSMSRLKVTAKETAVPLVNGIYGCTGDLIGSVDIFGKMIIDLDTSKIFAHNTSRWTALNPAVIAWELVPYSFVVDWFYDIGGYLSNLERSAQAAPAFKAGMWTRYKRFEGKQKLSGYTSWCKGDAYADVRCGEMKRHVLPYYPFPRLPSFNIDLGSNQWNSAAALLYQQLEHKMRSVEKPKKAKPSRFHF